MPREVVTNGYTLSMIRAAMNMEHMGSASIHPGRGTEDRHDKEGKEEVKRFRCHGQSR